LPTKNRRTGGRSDGGGIQKKRESTDPTKESQVEHQHCGAGNESVERSLRKNMSQEGHRKGSRPRVGKLCKLARVENIRGRKKERRDPEESSEPKYGMKVPGRAE